MWSYIFSLCHLYQLFRQLVLRNNNFHLFFLLILQESDHHKYVLFHFEFRGADIGHFGSCKCFSETIISPESARNRNKARKLPSLSVGWSRVKLPLSRCPLNASPFIPQNSIDFIIGLRRSHYPLFVVPDLNLECSQFSLIYLLNASEILLLLQSNIGGSLWLYGC